MTATALLRQDKVRFVLAGGWNTVLFLVTFAVVQILWGKHVGYVGSLTVSVALVTTQAYFIARRWVWKSANRARHEFPRFISVYLIQYLANLGLLFIFVTQLHGPVIPCQLSINVVLLALSYFAHRGWTFKAR